MDDIVLRGMAKWPNVPAVYGWLLLDRRGNWRIRGERIYNSAVIAFMGRNYARDDAGRWFFQNGPQRVFVALDYTPFVYRAVPASHASLALVCHTGAPARAIHGAWLDESGTLLIGTEHGIGILHDGDVDGALPCLVDANGAALGEERLETLIEALERRETVPLWLRVRETRVRVASIESVDVPRRFGFVADPQPSAGRDACP